MKTYKIDGETYTVFEITEEDIERSSTLSSEDLGKEYIFLNGCYVFIDNKEGDKYVW